MACLAPPYSSLYLWNHFSTLFASPEFAVSSEFDVGCSNAPSDSGSPVGVGVHA